MMKIRQRLDFAHCIVTFTDVRYGFV